MKVTDQHDEVVLEAKEPEVAMGEDTANIMNHMLQTVVTSGTGSAADFGSMPLIGKTGTTSESVDRWFVGGSPYYIAACWFGFDNPETLRASGNPALNIWKKVMEPIHEDLEDQDFPDTEMVTYRRYCTQTGLLATVNCPSTSVGWYKTSYLPACTSHEGRLASELDKPVRNPVPSNSSGGDDEDDEPSENTVTSAPAETSSAESATSSAPETSSQVSEVPSEPPASSEPTETSEEQPESQPEEPDSSQPEDTSQPDEPEPPDEPAGQDDPGGG